MFSFAQPLALLALILLPVIAWIGWPVRGPSHKRETISVILRLLIVLSMILALAGLEVTQSIISNKLAVIFLLDVSDSMSPAAKLSALDYVRQALAEMGPEDRAGVIVFGGNALVEQPLSNSRSLNSIDSIPNTTQTDLAEAIHLALALFPSDSAKRLVILSDGAVTTGDPINAAKLASASGVEIVAVPFIVDSGGEMLVSQVEVPDHLRQGDQFNLEVTIQSTVSGPASIRILSNGKLLAENQVEIHSGQQTFNYPLSAQQTGFMPYQVQIVPSSDRHYQNNQQAAYTLISGPPKILLVAPPAGEPMGIGSEIRPDEASALLSILKSGDFVVNSITPSGLPTELSQLVEYASVILVDVPARQINQRQMNTLTSFVRDLGGGLVTIGGPTSYGVGGYYRTQLEELLPLEMAIKDEQRRASLSIVFVIDHSGSMSETSGGVSKLELAKEAAIRSIELLFPTDRVGVVIFDDSAAWVSPLAELTDPSQVIYAVSTVRAGGGTDILAGLQAVASQLPDDPATVKHIILLTDGGADPTGIPELVEELNLKHGITLSTVGVGSDAAPYLPDLALLGQGRYHFASNPASIPSIFTEETTLATRSYIIEEAFTPQLLNSSPIISGISAFPPLQGYVGTSSKTRAQTILVTHKGDPLLAAWQYGLGKVAAFTSDATGRWAKEWLSWPSFSTFWIQTVQFTLGEPLPSSLETQIDLQGEHARLTIRALNPFSEDADVSSPFLNGYQFNANIIDPNGVLQEVSLAQTAPGQYQASFSPDAAGIYLLRIAGEPGSDQSPDLPSIAETTGWVLAYSPEYQTLSSDPDLLVRLISSTNGRLAERDPAQAFAHTLVAPNTRLSAWPFLLALAAILFPIDIASRRLLLSRSDIARFGQYIVQRVRSIRRLHPTLPAERQQQMDALLQVKQQSIERRPPPPESVAPVDQTGTQPVILSPHKNPNSAAERPAPPDPEKSESPTTTAATLLAHKRDRRKEK